MHILFFGPLSDMSAARHLACPPDIGTVAGLVNWLELDDPELGAALRQPGILVAVNTVLVGLDHELRGDDEIAFMSPMSGG